MGCLHRAHVESEAGLGEQAAASGASSQPLLGVFSHKGLLGTGKALRSEAGVGLKSLLQIGFQLEKGGKKARA